MKLGCVDSKNLGSVSRCKKAKDSSLMFLLPFDPMVSNGIIQILVLNCAYDMFLPGIYAFARFSRYFSSGNHQLQHGAVPTRNWLFRKDVSQSWDDLRASALRAQHGESRLEGEPQHSTWQISVWSLVWRLGGWQPAFRWTSKLAVVVRPNPGSKMTAEASTTKFTSKGFTY